MTSSASTKRVVELLQRFQPNDEFEMRVGTLHPTDGLTVSCANLEQLDEELRRSPSFKSSTWNESHVYYFHHNGREFRTTYSTDSNELQSSASTMCKTRKGVVDIPLGNSWSIRASLCSEEPVADNKLPPLATPHHVRIRQRASHVYRGKHCVVCYDLTRVWSGPTHIKTMELQAAREDPVCAVEIELVERMAGASDANVVDKMLGYTGHLPQQLGHIVRNMQ